MCLFQAVRQVEEHVSIVGQHGVRLAEGPGSFIQVTQAQQPQAQVVPGLPAPCKPDACGQPELVQAGFVSVTWHRSVLVSSGEAGVFCKSW